MPKLGKMRLYLKEVWKHLSLKIEGIVFDLFHTLVDPEDFRPTDFKRTEKIADLFKLDKEDFTKFWESNYRARYTSDSKKVVDYVEEYVTKTLGKPPSKQDLMLAELILGRYQDLAIEKPRPMVRGVLSSLRARGIKLGLLSNADEREARSWKGSSLATLFDSVCFSFEIGYMKPSKEAYSIALDRLGVLAQSCVYVGDGGEGELNGAKEAGFGVTVFMKGFVSRNGLRSFEELKAFALASDYTIDSLADLLLLVSKIED